MFDVGNLTSWVEESLLPFMGLFALHQFVENFYSFLQLSLLLISTASSTLHLQAFVATPPEHKLQKSRDVLILVTLNIWALSLLGLPDKNVWRAAFFLLPMRSFSWDQCLFYSVVTALLVKQWMVVPKTLVAVLCSVSARNATAESRTSESRTHHPLRIQPRILTAVEYVSMVWTDMLPLTIWFPYLLWIRPPPSMYASALAAGYVTLKARSCLPVIEELFQACQNVAITHRSYGKAISKEEALEAGAQCPICQDAPTGPIRLSCDHIFCDRCVSEWLERERTCPMCRCTVRTDTFQSYGNGTTNLLPSIF